MNKRLVFILNGKGGVGKSFFATNFVQYLKDRKLPHRAIDTDNENSTLKRYHDEADFADLNDPRGLDSLFAALTENPLVVVDGRAASTDLVLGLTSQKSRPSSCWTAWTHGSPWSCRSIMRRTA